MLSEFTSHNSLKKLITEKQLIFFLFGYIDSNSYSGGIAKSISSPLNISSPSGRFFKAL